MADKWFGHAAGFDFEDELTYTYNATTIDAPCTLLRTLIWVGWTAWLPYETGDAGVLLSPVGYAYCDTNSRNNPIGEVGPDPGNDGVEVIATDALQMSASALGWPPNASGTLSGSINELDSSGDIEMTYNTNQFMYAWATSFVDSKAQRIFDEQPQFQWTNLNFTFVTPLAQPGAHAWFMVRHLFRVSS